MGGGGLRRRFLASMQKCLFFSLHTAAEMFLFLSPYRENWASHILFFLAINFIIAGIVLFSPCYSKIVWKTLCYRSNSWMMHSEWCISGISGLPRLAGVTRIFWRCIYRFLPSREPSLSLLPSLNQYIIISTWSCQLKIICIILGLYN